ncbi:aminotransferase class V-fold PLP-dependent enzyme, partial [Microbacterium sp. ISL-103]|uniref:aminotransferase class V-fold PLP-dependent enzyme n=1 Tax=Microbacterium sp. ISL-103 TaxID=2819156 RepID=UPI001BEC0F0D
MLYLDHAATSPVRPEVLEAMRPYLTGVFGNPSSHHTVGEAAASALDDARRRVARILGMRTGDVVFTAGGTEANNLAVKGIVLAALAAERRHLVVSPIEHESILESADFLRRFHGVDVSAV